jgi:cell division protein ZapA
MEHTPPEKQTVRVTILSRPYSLRTSGDPREVEAIAATVNDLMLSIAGKSPDADSTRIAVLAALHFADRARSLEKELDDARQELSGQTERVSEMLDRVLAAGEDR